MKKIVIFIIIIAGLLLLSDFAYKTYRRNVLTDDKAVIFAYLNLTDDEIKDYFGLDESIYQELMSGKYRISCVIPEKSHLHLINIKDKTPLNDIDCDMEFDVVNHLEMNKDYHNGYKLRLLLFKSGNARSIAQKDVYINWDYGKVNHIVFDKNRAYKYCSK